MTGTIRGIRICRCVRALCPSLMLRVAALLMPVIGFASDGSVSAVFTGGADGTSRDLSVAGNWTGDFSSLVSVVDVSAFGTDFSVSSPMTLHGLRFTGNTGKVTVSGAGPLTLGSGGLTLEESGGISISCPVAVAAEQTWAIGGGALETFAAVTGVSPLTISGMSTFSHDPLPGYGGAVSYESVKKFDVTLSDGPWASSVTLKPTEQPSLLRLGSEEVDFADLFSGGSLSMASSKVLGFFGEGGTLTLGDGASIDSKSYFLEFQGMTLAVDGGTIDSGYHLSLGPISATVGDNLYPMTMSVDSGTVSSPYFFLYNKGSSVAPNRVLQSGGTVTSKQMMIGGAHSGANAAVSGYELSGDEAVLDISSSDSSYEYGLSLAVNPGSSAVSKTSHPGYYRQRGGTARLSRIQFGNSWKMWPHWGKTEACDIGCGYGVFRLLDGVLELGSDGFALGSNWNAGDATGSVYRIDLSGGTFKPAAGWDMDLAFAVASNAVPLVWHAPEGVNRVYAPVTGDGTLRKTGAGSLVLTDATGFKGQVEVAEGTLRLVGETKDAVGGCHVFTADDLELTTDAEVTSWTDADGSHGFTSIPAADLSDRVAPRYVAPEDSVFNGHAAVRFSVSSSQASGLRLPASANPLAGCTNATLVFVVSPAKAGLSAYADNYVWRYNRLLFGTPGDNDLLVTYMSDKRFVFGGTYPKATGGVTQEQTASAPAALDAPHVVVATLRGDEFSLDVDGAVTSVRVDEAARPLLPRHTDSAGRLQSVPLYLGTSVIDGDIGRSFDGDIAEVRVYPGRALSDSERRGVVATLLKKYVGASASADYLRRTADLSVAGDLSASAEDVPPAAAVPGTAYAWDAASLAGTHADGASVMTWTAANGTSEAYMANAAHAPVFSASAMNGRPAVRFDSARQTRLTVDYSDLPFTVPSGDNWAKRSSDGADYFKEVTMAVVFRSDSEGYGTHYDSGGMYNVDGVGLVSSTTAESWCLYWALTWDEGGAVGSCFSDGYNAKYNSPRTPVRLDDGQPHVAVVSRDFTGGDYVITVDGIRRRFNSPVGEAGLGSLWRRFRIGALTADGGWFTGDIAEVLFWEKALSDEETDAFIETMRKKYGIRRNDHRAYGIDALKAYGLSATNISVSAGATFAAPKTDGTPLTFGAGRTIGGAGRFEGSYRFGEGAEIDFAVFPADVEDVQVADGACLRFSPDNVPVDATAFSFLGGTVEFDVSDILASGARGRVTLMSLSPGASVEGTAFTLSGADPRVCSLEYDGATGRLTLHRKTGLSVSLR